MLTTDSASGIAIGLIDLEATFALRKAVLRPWLTPESGAAAFAGLAERFHVGALDGERVVSTASFTREADPKLDSLLPRARRWRLRAMATDPAFRAQGLGGRVLTFGVTELARRLAGQGEEAALLWCHGRSAAAGFYERHGFQTFGAVFETPRTGPHHVFWQEVAAG